MSMMVFVIVVKMLFVFCFLRQSSSLNFEIDISSMSIVEMLMIQCQVFLELCFLWRLLSSVIVLLLVFVMVQEFELVLMKVLVEQFGFLKVRQILNLLVWSFVVFFLRLWFFERQVVIVFLKVLCLVFFLVVFVSFCSSVCGRVFVEFLIFVLLVLSQFG